MVAYLLAVIATLLIARIIVGGRWRVKKPGVISYLPDLLERGNTRPIVAGSLLLIVLFSPLYYEFPGLLDRSTVITLKGGRVQDHPYGAFCWEFGHSCFDMPLGENGVSVIESVSGVNLPVATHYRFSVKIVAPNLFYADQANQVTARSFGADIREGRANDNGLVGREAILVGRQFHEFKNDHPAELVNLTNFTESGKQERLKAELESYINPRLKELGLRVEFQGFEVHCECPTSGCP